MLQRRCIFVYKLETGDVVCGWFGDHEQRKLYLDVYASKCGVWNFTLHRWNDLSSVCFWACFWNPFGRYGGRRLLQCLQCCDTDAKGSQDVFVSISFLLVYALSMWRQRNQKKF